MKIIELVLNDEQEDGVYAISIVDAPAIERNFIALSKNPKSQYTLAKIDKEQMMLVGPALIPNKQILRKDDEGNLYYVYMSKDTVKKAAYNFLKSSAHHNHTIMHEQPIEGLYVAESWIIEDENDKSKKYGFTDLPLGTWMVAVKVENDKIWQEKIKSGEVKGFSIEAYFTHKMKAKTEDEQMNEVIEAAKVLIDKVI